MSDTIKIRTNHAWRPFVYRGDVPAKVLQSQFDHLSEDDSLDGFFCYRGYWYHLSDFMRNTAENSPLKDWHGVAGDSYFSGVLIRVSGDGERYQVATYLS